MLRRLAMMLEAALAAISITLLILLAAIVVIAVGFRYSGQSLVWYDEVAAVLLAWISFIGAGYVSLRRGHLGADAVMLMLPPRIRFVAFCVSEAVIVLVFLVVAYYGWGVLAIMAGETLVGLRWLPLSFTQSCVPIGAGLIIVAQLASAPAAWERLAAGLSEEESQIQAEIERARAGFGAHGKESGL